MDLAPRQAWLHAAGRQEAVGAAASRGAPAGAGQGDIAALEQPVLVISVIGEAADRALGARRAVAVVERAVAVLPAPDRIGVVFGQVRRGLERVLAPGVGRVRAQELRGQPGVARSEEHTSELQSLMRISYAVFCLKKKNKDHNHINRRVKRTYV